MEMFLMAVSLSIFGLGIACLAFGAATRPEQPATAPAAEQELPKVAAEPRPRFFRDDAHAPATVYARVPVEALLLQIESHVRMEQAVAESYLEYPNAALLHSRTMSPLIQ
jgi:hypothetical protein